MLPEHRMSSDFGSHEPSLTGIQLLTVLSWVLPEGCSVFATSPPTRSWQATLTRIPKIQTFALTHPTCDTILLWHVQGNLHYFQNDAGDQVQIFTSSDGSMTHFTLGKQLTLCGQIVYTTDYTDLFLLDFMPGSATPLRTLPGQFSIVTLSSKALAGAGICALGMTSSARNGRRGKIFAP